MSPTRVRSALSLRLPPSTARLVRYGFVGAGVSVFYSALVFGCMSLPISLNPTFASVVAFVVTIPVGWYAHSSISFADRPRDSFQPLRFVVTTAASFLAAVGGMYWITEIAGRSWLLGIAWNWLVIPLVNFLIYLFWVFRNTNPGGPSA